MEKEHQNLRPHERWAHFRFSVIGLLLAAPAARGELQHRLKELAAKKWRHPLSGQGGPVEVLKRKIRSDHGTHPSVGLKLAELLATQYRQHPSWSYQLHF